MNGNDDKAAELLPFTQFSVDYASDAIFWVDAEGKFIYTNHAASALFGYTRAEFLTMSIFDLEVSQSGRKNWPKFWAEMREKRSLILESDVKRKDGSFFRMEIRTNFYIFQGKEFKVTYGRDITQKKKAEEALHQKNGELQKVNAELDRFVYSVSHDLRAPLVSILGLVNVALLQITDPRQMQYLDMIATTARRLDELVLSITDYSRNARTELLPEKVEITKEVNDAIANLRHMQGAEQIKFRVNSNELDVFYSDRARIRVILHNLISNAIKYANMLQQPPYVEIDVTVKEGKAIIAIKDNGQGIAEEHHEKMFTMFYRASSNSFGSGLGLYIVKEVVGRLGGKIDFESEEGKGTEFYIELPDRRK